LQLCVEVFPPRPFHPPPVLLAGIMISGGKLRRLM
jgi:hypothetical protein